MTFSNSRGFLITLRESSCGLETAWRTGASEAFTARGYSSPLEGSNARLWGRLAAAQDAAGCVLPMDLRGASDYHRSRSSHLFFSKGKPSFRWFRQKVMEQLDGVEAELHLPEHASQHQVISPPPQ
jgi:hypothetical protein